MGWVVIRPVGDGGSDVEEHFEGLLDAFGSFAEVGAFLGFGFGQEFVNEALADVEAPVAVGSWDEEEGREGGEKDGALWGDGER